MYYDLLIKAGRVIDPSAGLDGKMDIGIAEGKISDVSPDLDADSAREVIDAGRWIVTPGLIDLHAHALFLNGYGLGADLDQVCRSSGVTTLVDGGSSGAATFPVLKEQLIDSCETRIRSFLHISTIGLADLTVGESTYLDLHKPEQAAETARAFPETIVGIKVRQQAEAVGGNGLEPLKLAKQAALQAGGIRTMVHVTHPPLPLKHMLELMDPGDVVTHFLHGRGMGILDEDGGLSGCVFEARKRGILFDVGHGTNHLDFNIARLAIERGFFPDTISTDLTRKNMAGAVKNLPHTLSKFLNLGMALGSVIACATHNPARILGMEGSIGTIKKGAIADIAMFQLESGNFMFKDSQGNDLAGEIRLAPVCTICKGAVTWQKR
ncbi:MAG: amidohydrolase/deacetylase family metallohydrolase [Sedimentisphaerales bacterium]|nr:amidohydrolase/deacetylase family metallohydrolase [Sedimentisphaerales bacterium]